MKPRELLLGAFLVFLAAVVYIILPPFREEASNIAKQKIDKPLIIKALGTDETKVTIRFSGNDGNARNYSVSIPEDKLLIATCFEGNTRNWTVCKLYRYLGEASNR